MYYMLYILSTLSIVLFVFTINHNKVVFGTSILLQSVVLLLISIILFGLGHISILKRRYYIETLSDYKLIKSNSFGPFLYFVYFMMFACIVTNEFLLIFLLLLIGIISPVSMMFLFHPYLLLLGYRLYTVRINMQSKNMQTKYIFSKTDIFEDFTDIEGNIRKIGKGLLRYSDTIFLYSRDKDNI